MTRTTSRLTRIAALALAVACLAPAAAADDTTAPPRKTRTHPGFVDGSSLAQLVDPDGRLIEVTMDRKLLKLFTSKANRRKESVIASILGDLDSINAVIGEIGDEEERIEREIQRVRSDLEREGWERFVRVREHGDDFSAYIHVDEDDEEMIDGLLVIGFHEGGDEVLFVNLAGRIDMERIALLGEHMGLPGLDELPPMSEVERHREARGEGDRDESKNASRDDDLEISIGRGRR
jgi:hypothetical protein